MPLTAHAARLAIAATNAGCERWRSFHNPASALNTAVTSGSFTGV